MLFDVELDLTPEGAESMREFDELFNGGLFYLLASTGKMGRTDIATLLRVSDEVVSRAHHCNLCSPPIETLDLQSRIDRIKNVLAESDEITAAIVEMVLAWFYAQTPETQAAVLALFVSLTAWLEAKLAEVSPETKAVVQALIAVVKCLRPATAGTRQG